jgi:long-chain fatty acid transport protein
MKRNISVLKRLFPVSLLIFAAYNSMAGGILTNTNQSAQWVRMLSRNASTQIDAVYFNPAGVMKMENGFHIALQNQSLFQTRTIKTTRPTNNKEYTGEVKAYLFPTAFLVYKLDGVAFSFGFGPNGGGGSASFDKGLPSFEGKIASQLLPKFPAYSVDIAFDAQSVFYGLQLGVSWKMGEMVSGYAGARYLPSVNQYTGHIRDIMVKVGSTMTLASPYFALGATAAGGASAQIQQLINLGAGNNTIAQVQNNGYISSATRAQLENGLAGLGLTPAQIAALNMNQVKSTFDAGKNTLEKAASDTKDLYVDTRATGFGITPIFGINIAPTEELNIGLKYEHKTKLRLTNDTKMDPATGYGDGGMEFLKDEKTIPSDIPGIITAGVSYKFTKKFLASVSFNEYLDKGVDWATNIYGEKRTIEKNYWELALGLQYNIVENFALSAGVMQSTTGVSEQYQSDFSYSNNSNTFGGGFQWNITKRLTFDAGVLYTTYAVAKKSFYKDAQKTILDFSETYDKVNYGFAFGIGYRF